MGQLDFKWDSILNLFFNYPAKEFQIRELSRLSGIPKTTVERVVKLLLKKKLVSRTTGMVFAAYRAEETNFWYKFYKKYYLLRDIYSSGLVDFLESFHPQCILLFGSGAKGDYVKKSDLDIFLLGPQRKVDLARYERKLRRKINLLFKENFHDLRPELFNNILNGIKLSGYIKLK